MNVENPWANTTNYIWLPQGESAAAGAPYMALFRKTAEFSEIPARLLVHVTADSRYRLIVNGKDVCCGPCKGDKNVWYYEEIDIAPFLKIGENVLAARVLRYPPESTKGNLSVFRTEVPHFYLKEIENGGRPYGISTDESWKCTVCCGIEIKAESEHSRYLWNCEKTDGYRIFFGWEHSGGQGSLWGHARVYRSGEVQLGRSPRMLKKRPIPLLPETERNYKRVVCIRKSNLELYFWETLIRGDGGVTLQPGSNHLIELDAGELTTGYYDWTLTGGTGAEISVTAAEAYSQKKEDGRLHKWDREDYIQGRINGYTNTYMVGGYGTGEVPETYSPFWFQTFRFVQIRIQVKEEPLTICKFNYRETGYPLEVRTSVETSDRELGRIWDISLRTLRRCMHETYEDCPYYEQLQYAMDTRAQILFTYCVSADDRLARKCFDDFHRSLRPDGLTNCCYPSMGTNLIPGFSLYYIFMLHDHMMYYGDRNLLRDYNLTAQRILSFFEKRKRADGLVDRIGGYNGEHEYWSFIDWTEKWKWGVPNAIRTGPLTMESLLYLEALTKMADISEYLNDRERAVRYRAEAAALARTVREKCYSTEKQLYQDGPGYEDDFSQHTQVFCILSGLVEGAEAAALMERTLEKKELAQCSVAMSYYLFRAVEKAGLYKEKSQRLWEPWREMLARHLTTCAEKNGESRSDCHAWGAAALYELPSVLLGVRPEAPGYKKASVRPNSSFLTYAKGSVITPHGYIKVCWEKRPGGMEVEIDASDYRGEIIK